MPVEKLEAEVRKHNRLYFVGHKPVISDYEFDRLVEELRRKKPDSLVLTGLISDVTSAGAKVTHEIPMLSLDKCYDEKAINDWGAKFEGDVIASPKIDGCAVSIKYGSDGKIAQAATRGDGVEGEDITANARFIKDIPKHIGVKNVEVRGEVYMPLSIFDRYKEEFANPRNLAAGAIKQKDPRKTGQYELSFLGYDLLGAGLKTETEKRKTLEEEKFKVVEWKKFSKDKIQQTYDGFFAKRDKYDFETDGVVFRADLVSEQDRLGSTAHHPRFAIAYKYQGESGTTILKDVEWSVARTGVITPVAVVEPVELSGVTVTRASLHNVGIMKKLGITKGAKVIMMRRGGVIPNVEQVVKCKGKPAQIPKRCPSCGGETVLREDFLYCTRPSSCVRSKIAELEHYVKEAGIDGFGVKLITQLYANGIVTDPSEFYILTKEDLLQLERMGDTLAAKLIKNIKDKSEFSLEVFLRSLGIREVGKHVSKILGGYGDIKKVMALKKEELSSIHTIGDVIAHEVVSGLKSKKPLIKKLLKHVKIKKVETKAKGPLAGKKVLFTGALVAIERREAQKIVEVKGGEAAGGVSKELDFLVVGDGGGTGSKLDKTKKIIAQGGKTKIIKEKEFLKMVGKR